MLQSRLYKTSGGTRGSQAESKLYRDLVQRELTELEDVSNLWLTEKYCGNKRDIYIHTGCGFGGYTDWVHSEFDAKISIREDHLNDYKVFEVGTYGLCVCCGEEISHGLYCDSCDPDENEYLLCDECHEYFPADEVVPATDANGERVSA